MDIHTLIPCHNAELWIGEAIESTLNQNYPHTEVIVYDDGSTDGSWDIIQSFGDRIAAGQGPNRGGGAARNWLLERASGPWVQYLDADDCLRPDKINGQVDVLEAKSRMHRLAGFRHLRALQEALKETPQEETPQEEVRKPTSTQHE